MDLLTKKVCGTSEMKSLEQNSWRRYYQKIDNAMSALFIFHQKNLATNDFFKKNRVRSSL